MNIILSEILSSRKYHSVGNVVTLGGQAPGASHLVGPTPSEPARETPGSGYPGAGTALLPGLPVTRPPGPTARALPPGLPVTRPTRPPDPQTARALPPGLPVTRPPVPTSRLDPQTARLPDCPVSAPGPTRHPATSPQSRPPDRLALPTSRPPDCPTARLPGRCPRAYPSPDPSRPPDWTARPDRQPAPACPSLLLPAKTIAHRITRRLTSHRQLTEVE